MLGRRRRGPPSLVALAAFIGVGFADARAADPCPHHDRLPEPTRASAHAHAGRPTDPSPERDGQRGHGEHGACTCVGSCDPGASTGLVERPAVAAAPPPIDRSTRAPGCSGTAHRSASRWSPHLPNAPPLAV
jgi:hypothetical protein